GGAAAAQGSAIAWPAAAAAVESASFPPNPITRLAERRPPHPSTSGGGGLAGPSAAQVEIELRVPFVGQVDKRPADRYPFERAHRVEQDRPLARAVERLAKRVAHWGIDEHGARRFYLCAYVAGGGNDHGGNSGFFEHARDQTDGLVVERSGRHQDGGVNQLRAQAMRQRGRG